MAAPLPAGTEGNPQFFMKQHRPSTPDVLIVGGSIGGLSAAHALQQAGCKVRVLERAAVVSSPTGAVSRLDSPISKPCPGLTYA